MDHAASDIKPSSFILSCYRHFLNGNNESIEKLGTENLKIPKFKEEDLIDLCDSAIEILKETNKTIVYLPSPSIVIGDLHGNLHDLIRFMNSIIDVFSNRVLFLGDYIDRGQFQLETITVLLALRIEYPDHFFLIRGNHEFTCVNMYGGLKDEIIQSGYSESLFNKINETFCWLPIAAVINDHIFCVHGGLSPLFHDIKQIENEFRLPIKNIYTNSNKKQNKLNDSSSSSSRVANMNLRSSLTNLGTNGAFLQNKKLLNMKSSLQNVKVNQDNTKSHPPKFLPLCKQSNLDFVMNKKLPPLLTKSPLPNLSDVKPSISPSTNMNSELENSIANFSNSNQTTQNSDSSSSNSAPQDSSIILPIPQNQSQIQNQSLNSKLLLPMNSNSEQSTVHSGSPLKNSKALTSDMNVFYISSGQLDLISKYKESLLNESNEDERNNTELLTDLLWSDPTNSCERFLPSNRGSGCYFGFVATSHFLKKNGMKMIVRGHESIKKGIDTNHDKKVITIYSSSSIRQGGIAGCAIFDVDDTYKEFKLVPIDFVQRSEAMFYTPTIRQKKNNTPLKLNSFSRSQSIFGNTKKLRRNTFESNPQLIKSSPNHESVINEICTIKEEEGE